MRNHFKILIPIVVSCVVILPASARGQSVCSAILRNGVFDTTTLDQAKFAADAFSNFYSRMYASSSGSSTGVGASYAGWGGTFNQAEQARMQEAVAAYQTKDGSQADKLQAYAKTASSIIANAWTECIKSEQAGVRVSMRTLSDRNTFFLVFAFVTTDSVRHPTAKISQISPSAGLECQQTAITVASTAEVAVRCHRTANTSVNVSFQSSDTIVFGQSTFDFPPILDVPKPDPLPTAWAAIDANQFQDSTNITDDRESNPARRFAHAIDRNQPVRLIVPLQGTPSGVTNAHLWMNYASQNGSTFRVAVARSIQEAKQVVPTKPVFVPSTGGDAFTTRNSIDLGVFAVTPGTPATPSTGYVVLVAESGSAFPYVNGFWLSR